MKRVVTNKIFDLLQLQLIGILHSKFYLEYWLLLLYKTLLVKIVKSYLKVCSSSLKGSTSWKILEKQFAVKSSSTQMEIELVIDAHWNLLKFSEQLFFRITQLMSFAELEKKHGWKAFNIRGGYLVKFLNESIFILFNFWYRFFLISFSRRLKI